MKVRIKQRPTGAYNGEPWPEKGEVIDIPDHVALGMLNSGHVEAVKSTAKTEAATPDGENVEKAVKKTTTRKR